MTLSSVVVPMFGRALGALNGPRLSILIFHRVLRERDPLLPGEPDAMLFDMQVRWLMSAFRIFPLVEAMRRVADRNLPSNAACITFDDGYADNLTVAAPILAGHRVPATFFIATGFLDGGRMWNDTVIEAVRLAPGPRLDLSALGLGEWRCANASEKIATIRGLLARLKYLEPAARLALTNRIADRVGLAAKSNLMMTSGQVRALRGMGMSIGGHTVTHPILTSLPEEDARREIVDGCARLTEITQERPRVFAYPNGKPGQDYDATHVRQVREMGFDGAVSTSWGVARHDSDRFQLPRFTPWDRNMDRFGMRLAQNFVRRGETV
jgi:peptidoglycan/xylan/chitin deacetylase (PgdA/CDA1 family)